MTSILGSSLATEVVLDAATFILFVAFVAFLFFGYLGFYHPIPFSALAAVALFGSLAVLFIANWRADRRRLEAAVASGP
ncbi:MAG TPA: hypothetical protein VEG66_07090 [Thermoplasmata archaeon]|nr:hypothetical protein [Thermoplasmata archaeon]